MAKPLVAERAARPWLLVLGAPVLTFVVLGLIRKDPERRATSFPPPDPACAARLEVERRCEPRHVRPCFGCRHLVCEAGPDWRLPLVARDLVPGCRYALFANYKGNRSDAADHWIRGGELVPCTRRAATLDCTLALEPVRPIGLALIGEAPGSTPMMAAPGLVVLARDGALDVRPEAVPITLALFGVAIVGAAALLALARRQARRTSALGWATRGVATALGAALSLTLALLLPADMGGFDRADPSRLVTIVPVGALVGFAFGPLAGRLRAAYTNRSRAFGFVLVLGAIVLGVSYSFFYKLATSEGVAMDDTASPKTLFYAAWGVATLLPAVVWPGAGLVHAPRVFGVTLLSAIVIGAFALGVVELVGEPTHQGLLRGFHKPPSAFAFTLLSLPFLAALAIAATSGSPRPPWLDRVVGALDAALSPGHPDDRAPRARALARALALHADDLARASPEALAPLAWLAPGVLAPLVRDPHERAQLGLGDTLDAALGTLVRARTPETIVRRDTGPGERATLLLIPYPRAAQDTLTVVLEGGVPAADGAHAQTLARDQFALDAARRDTLGRGGYLVVDHDARETPGGLLQPPATLRIIAS